MQPFAADPYTGLSVDSSAFRQRAPVLNLSDDPDTATQQTVQEMCRQIHQAARDPLVRSIAHQAVRSIRGGPTWVGTGLQPFEHPRIMAESCWWWCKTHLKFQHHSGMFEVWSADLGDPRTKLQLLISPDVLVRMRSMKGDCAIYTMMVSSMLEALGCKWEICTGAVDGSQPDIFSHVWPRVVLPDGGREPLDASHGKYPGWQVPPQDIYRLKVWNEQGGEVANQARSFSGLHAYRRRRGFGAYVCPDPTNPDSCYDDGSGPYTLPYPTGNPPVYGNPPAGIDPTSMACTCVGGSCIENGNSCGSPAPASTPITVPPQNTVQWTNMITALTKAGVSLAQLQSLKPGMVINPNGQLIYQSPGYAVNTGQPGTNIATPFGSASMTSMLPWLLGFGALALMLGSKR